MRGYNSYDKKTLWVCLFQIGLMIAALMVSGGSAAAIFPLLAIGALIRNRAKGLLFTVILMIVATVGNQYFFPKNFTFAVAVRATLAFLAVAIMLQNAGQRMSLFVTPLAGILWYLVWACISSAQGWSPIVSYLKIILFTAIYFSYYSVANKAALSRQITIFEIRAIFLSMAIFFIFGSALLLPFPSIGMMNMSDFYDPAQAMLGVSLFKGMTMHSQSLGPIVAGLATLLFADLIFSIKRWDPVYVVLLILSPYLIFKTSSRTAMGAFIGGIGTATWLFMRARGVGHRWKGKIMSLMTMIAVSISCAVLILPSTRQKVMAFMYKVQAVEANETLNFEELTVTRQGLVDQAMYNFHKKPIIGNGFQVSEEMVSQDRKTIASYLSAPIEKGVWVSAVLEEGGVVGFALFAGFLLYAFILFIRRRAFIAASLLILLTLTNMGEFTFFSMSYTGGILWLFEFCAVVMDAQRETNSGGLWSPYVPGQYYV